MSFFSENDRDSKQHVNLSDHAWNIIENDIFCFSEDCDRVTISDILNRIFLGFYEQANASIAIAEKRKQEELLGYFNDFPRFDKGQNDLKDKVISKMLDTYINQLKERTLKYPSGTGRKFRLSKTNLDYLFSYNSECWENLHYSSAGKYLKAIYEEYALLPYHERELIYFKETVDTINTAIKEERRLSVTLHSGLKFHVRAYKIVMSNSNLFNFVAAYSSPAIASVEEPAKIASFRLSRIRSIKMLHESGALNARQKKEIEKAILTKDPYFLLDEPHGIRIWLSDEGIKKYGRQFHLRPPYLKIEGEGHIYVFECTQRQIEYFFFKFGKDAVILSPEDLRASFALDYLQATQAYTTVLTVD